MLGKVLGAGAGIAAIPFTGGASASILPAILGAGSGVASAIGGSQAANRNAQNQYGMDQGRLIASLYNTNQNALMQSLLGSSNEAQQNAGIDLSQKNFALNAPATRAQQAARGSILQTLQPATMSGGSARLRAATPTISGGLSAANLNQGARDAGRMLEDNALKGLQSGDTFAPLPQTDFKSGVLPLPSLPQFQQPGTGESILGLLGLAGPALLEAFRQPQKPNTQIPPGSTTYTPVIPGSQFTGKP